MLSSVSEYNIIKDVYGFSLGGGIASILLELVIKVTKQTQASHNYSDCSV